MRNEKKKRKAKRKEKKEMGKENKEKEKQFVERKEGKRIKKKKERKNFRLSGGRSSTIRGLKLVYAARSTCGHQKVGVSTTSTR